MCADCHGRSYAYIRNLGIQTPDAVQLDSDPLYNVLVHPNVGWDPSDRRVLRQYAQPQSGEIPTITQPLQATNPFTPIQINHEDSTNLQESSPSSKKSIKAAKKASQKRFQIQNSAIGGQNQPEDEEVDVEKQPDAELEEILKKPQDQLSFDEIMQLTGGPSEIPLDLPRSSVEGVDGARKDETEQISEKKVVKPNSNFSNFSNSVDSQEKPPLKSQKPKKFVGSVGWAKYLIKKAHPKEESKTSQEKHQTPDDLLARLTHQLILFGEYANVGMGRSAGFGQIKVMNR